MRYCTKIARIWVKMSACLQKSSCMIVKLSTATLHDVTVTCLARQALGKAVAPPSAPLTKSNNSPKSATHNKSTCHKFRTCEATMPRGAACWRLASCRTYIRCTSTLTRLEEPTQTRVVGACPWPSWVLDGTSG